MRRKIVAGNWKMNKNFKEAKELALHLNTWVITNRPTAEVIIAPPMIYLHELEKDLSNSKINVSSQDVSSEPKGAFTGEVSAEQLHSIEIKYSLVGHSERREYHGETNEDISKKIAQLYLNKITPILCVGEKLEEREAKKHFNVVKDQVIGALKNQQPENLENLIIAYEPVWAIGTGKTASPEDAQEIHNFIRKTLNENFGTKVAEGTSILYGGSVNPGNARDLFSQEDIDGGLVGGASLQYEDFTTIISAYN